jgi:hypothetical protein
MVHDGGVGAVDEVLAQEISLCDIGGLLRWSIEGVDDFGGLGFGGTSLVVPCDTVHDGGVGAVDEVLAQETSLCDVGGLLRWSIEGVDDFGASNSCLNLGCSVIHELLRLVPPPNSITEASFASKA